jgi:hypothetical protein
VCAEDRKGFWATVQQRLCGDRLPVLVGFTDGSPVSDGEFPDEAVDE